MEALRILSFHDVYIFDYFGMTQDQCGNIGLYLIISNDF